MYITKLSSYNPTFLPYEKHLIWTETTHKLYVISASPTNTSYTLAYRTMKLPIFTNLYRAEPMILIKQYVWIFLSINIYQLKLKLLHTVVSS
jgi:hypothetical protein